MRRGYMVNCVECGNLTEILSLDSKVLCPKCILKELDKRIYQREPIDDVFIELWKTFGHVILPLIEKNT